MERIYLLRILLFASIFALCTPLTSCKKVGETVVRASIQGLKDAVKGYIKAQIYDILESALRGSQEDAGIHNAFDHPINFALSVDGIDWAIYVLQANETKYFKCKKGRAIRFFLQTLRASTNEVLSIVNTTLSSGQNYKIYLVVPYE